MPANSRPSALAPREAAFDRRAGFSALRRACLVVLSSVLRAAGAAGSWCCGCSSSPSILIAASALPWSPLLSSQRRRDLLEQRLDLGIGLLGERLLAPAAASPPRRRRRAPSPPRGALSRSRRDAASAPRARAAELAPQAVVDADVFACPRATARALAADGIDRVVALDDQHALAGRSAARRRRAPAARLPPADRPRRPAARSPRPSRRCRRTRASRPRARRARTRATRAATDSNATRIAAIRCSHMKSGRAVAAPPSCAAATCATSCRYSCDVVLPSRARPSSCRCRR